jgi:hypothetical protein
MLKQLREGIKTLLGKGMRTENLKMIKQTKTRRKALKRPCLDDYPWVMSQPKDFKYLKTDAEVIEFLRDGRAELINQEQLYWRRVLKIKNAADRQWCEEFLLREFSAVKNRIES